MIRHLAGDIDPADDRNTVLDHCLAGTSQFAVASALCGQIKDHRARRHSFYHLAGHEYRGFLARYDSRGDNHIAPRDHATEKFTLPCVEVLILRRAISVRILRVSGFNREFNEPPTQALRLFFGCRSQIVRRGDRQHGEDSWQGAGRDENGYVATDRAHRGERVHALRSRGTWHQLLSERDDPRLGNLLDYVQ